MYTNALDRIEYGDKAAERAQSEEMEFNVPTAGVVVVTNVSHDSAHSVNVDQGVPVTCSCKADEYQQDACKHRVAVALAKPVLAAASASGPDGKRAMADGGTIAAPNPRVRATEPPTRRVAITRSARGSTRTPIGHYSRLSAGTNGPRTTRTSESRRPRNEGVY